jgi:RND family efflux transporter MFP subunit
MSATFIRALAFACFGLILAGPAARAQTGEERAVSVAAMRVTRQNLTNEVEFTADFRPYLEVELHSKVAGYLTWISVDFGDVVKEGQQIAQLEVPELRDDLENAKADEARSLQEVERAGAAARDAHVIHTRLTGTEKARPGLISQQDLDTAEARDLGAEAAAEAAKQGVRQARAKVGKLETMLKYTKITAPFDGVVTKRYVDPGSLVQASSSSETQTLPVVRLSMNQKLRFDFVVQVDYVSKIRAGDEVEIRFKNGGRRTAKITRFTRRVEMDTRTMIAEAEVLNPDLAIIPGVYAKAWLHPDHRSSVLAAPLQAVAGDQRKTVFRINEKGEIEERVVETGLETPSMIEITSGLKEGDLVMIGDRARVAPGVRVKARVFEAEGTK